MKILKSNIIVMKTTVISFLLAMSFISCNIKNRHNSIQEEQSIDDVTKQKMFNIAYIHQSTAPYYVVVTIKNINTGEIKEICTESSFLEGALHREYKMDYSHSFNLDSATTRYFELSKDSALWNISFDLYTQEELQLYKSTLNIDSIINILKEKRHLPIQFPPYSIDNKEQIMYAHIMFNNGIMMRRGCEAGNYCSLVFYDSTKLGIPFLDPDWDYY